MSYRIGLDLGGTNIKGGLVGLDGRVIADRSIPTESDGGPAHVIERLAMLAREMTSQAGLDLRQNQGIGVGTPGPLNEDCTVVLRAPNMPGWVNIPLRDQLSAAVGLPVKVFNDAKAATYGEFCAGAGRDAGVKNMVMLTLGTGIGAGVVLQGRIFVGAHGAGTEMGHVIVEPNGLPCGCGQHGCLEQYASATGIAAMAARKMAAGGRTSLPSKPTARDVFDAAAAGDALATQTADEVCTYLGLACVNFVRIFDPQLVVLGGGVIAAGEALLGRVRGVFTQRTWKVRPERVKIVAATLGNQAGFIGAAAMAGV